MQMDQRPRLTLAKSAGSGVTGVGVSRSDIERRPAPRGALVELVHTSGGRVGSVAASTIRATAGAVAAGAVIVVTAVGTVICAGGGASVAASTSAISIASEVAPSPMSPAAIVAVAVVASSPTTPATSPSTSAKSSATTTTGNTSSATSRPVVSQGQVFAALFLVLIAAAWMVYRNRSNRDEIGDASRDDFS